MAGTTVPAQMYDHELNPVKGWPSPYALDKSAEIASGVLGILAGMCISLDAGSGKWKRGCLNGEMPCFAFQNQGDFDVASDVGNISGGNLTGLVATGGYELETTEYTGSGFTVQIPLTAENTPGGNQGKLKATTIGGTDMIVGICNRGPVVNEFGKNMIRFWPVYLPKR